MTWSSLPGLFSMLDRVGMTAKAIGALLCLAYFTADSAGFRRHEEAFLPLACCVCSTVGREGILGCMQLLVCILVL